MARTRGASNVFHQDDGELLDKEGKPIPTTRVEPTRPSVIHMDDGELVAPAPVVSAVPLVPRTYRYICDRTTWQRNMEAYEAMQLLDVLTGGLAANLDETAWRGLSADARRHFRRVVAEEDTAA